MSLLFDRRAFLGIAAALSFVSSALAELRVGASAVTTQELPLVTNTSASPAMIPAGGSVTIIGLRSATNEAVVSYQPPGGQKLVGVLPASFLLAIDSPSSSPGQPPASNPPPRATRPVQPPAAPAPPVTPPDLAKTLPAEEIARFFKADKAAASALCDNKRIKFSGVIDKLELDSASSGSGEIPILYLKTATGLPRLKVKLSNSISTGDTYFRRFSPYLPGWWWGYSSRALDCKLVGLNEIQGRAVYRSGGGSSVSSYRSSSPWFTLFKVGDPVAIEAYCKGLYMDVTFESGILLAEQ